MASKDRFASLERGKKLMALGEGIRDFRPALKQIGALLAGRAQAAFVEQKRGRIRWAARMTPNIPGIVSDLNRGASVKGRRFDPRPAGVDTGNLRGSITFKVSGPRIVEIGTKVPYAGIIQEGGVSTVILTKAGRDNLATFLRQRRDLQPQLGWLFNKPEFIVRVRARPFLAVTAQDRQDINSILEDHVGG